MDVQKTDSEILNTILINLYSLSKENGYIKLRNFDPENCSHLCILEIAKIEKSLFQIPVVLEIKWPLQLWYRFKFRKDHFQFAHKLDGDVRTNCDVFIHDLMAAYGVEESYIANLYHKYYELKEDMTEEDSEGIKLNG